MHLDWREDQKAKAGQPDTKQNKLEEFPDTSTDFYDHCGLKQEADYHWGLAEKQTHVNGVAKRRAEGAKQVKPKNEKRAIQLPSAHTREKKVKKAYQQSSEGASGCWRGSHFVLGKV